jgi:hypothetical protein
MLPDGLEALDSEDQPYEVRRRSQPRARSSLRRSSPHSIPCAGVSTRTRSSEASSYAIAPRKVLHQAPARLDRVDESMAGEIGQCVPE